MKKFSFIALLGICIAAIAVTNGNSQKTGISAEYLANAADTTPAHHHSNIHKTMVHKRTMVKKPVKDSTKM